MTKTAEEIEDKFKEEMQGVYSRLQEFSGIEYGDIEPLQLLDLEEKEDALARVVVSWLVTEEEDED